MITLIAAALAAAAPATPATPAQPADPHAQHKQAPGGMNHGSMKHGDMAAMMEQCCKEMMAKMHGNHAGHQAQGQQQHHNHKQ